MFPGEEFLPRVPDPEDVITEDMEEFSPEAADEEPSNQAETETAAISNPPSSDQWSNTRSKFWKFIQMFLLKLNELLFVKHSAVFDIPKYIYSTRNNTVNIATTIAEMENIVKNEEKKMLPLNVRHFRPLPGRPF